MPLLGAGPADRAPGPGVLRASELVVFDGRDEVCRHADRATAAADTRLDHYLEVLHRKPGALPGATALVQARQAGVFTAAHEAFWAAARKAHGDAAGTRALIEVLLLHRHTPAADVIAGITAALSVGASSPDVVAVEARKAGEPPEATAAGYRRSRPLDPGPTPTPVISLTQRRLAALPADTRPRPSVDHYDELLHRRTPPVDPTFVKENCRDHPPRRDRAGRRRRRSTRPAGSCGCRPSAAASARSPTPPNVNNCPTSGSSPNW